MSEINLPMDQRETTQYCQAGHLTDETTNARTDGFSQAIKQIRSGKQKDFMRQLYGDLTNQGLSCFFDQDPERFAVGEDVN
ncbi:hypothetical protein SUGI_1199990 [Cryptomeria japonica]|nr:hypothetical protein SUGI_1199990 [Cryptomeria japonica]